MEKMRLRARIRTWLANSRRRRVRLFLGRSISFLTLISFLVIVVVAVLGGVGLELTNRPIFCISCHEMSVHYATWRESTHKSVTCEECHVMPGMMNMFKSKVKAVYFVYQHQKGGVKPSVIRGHVPDITCKQCHPETRDLLVYHSLQITHKKHWDRGISCTTCHDRVVHGPRPESVEKAEEISYGRPLFAGKPISFKYTPQMSTCYKCHDGKKAPNTCSTCHVTLGERRVAAFDPAWVEAHKENIRKEGSTCTDCHQSSFCTNCHISANPHPSNWTSAHPQDYKKNTSSCQVCHRAPHEKANDIGMVYCRACHTLRREHKSANWMALHQDEFRTNPEKCSSCHTQTWCADCHQITRSHPPLWLQTHPSKAKKSIDSCRTCHREDFCIACHKGKAKGVSSIPATHKDKPAWLINHKAAVGKQSSNCSVCHEPGFCQACHKNARPSSHEHRWLKLHGQQAGQDAHACMLCHKETYCSSCHGLKIPHPATWLEQHGSPAAKAKKTCANCHPASFCDSCHRGRVPTSHEASGAWLAGHGKAAISGKEKCEMCHRAALCDSCHGLKLPHTSGWLPKGHAAQAKTDAQTCARCHKADYCSSCHGLPMPHPSDWMESHPKNAQASFKKDSVCFRCHKTEDCSTCHGSPLPQK
jgi:nitrate/TMAO reductase-like tetraheme cytochrome c subunit